MVAKRHRKQKAGTQDGKKSRKPKGVRAGAGGSRGGSSASGTMTGLRGMFKAAAGTGGSKKQQGKFSKAIDVALWIAVAGAGVYFIANAQCSG